MWEKRERTKTKLEAVANNTPHKISFTWGLRFSFFFGLFKSFLNPCVNFSFEFGVWDNHVNG
eukprot:m.25657 g.25657  ORF g.25657 m.25657 type:complete len:62 (-) comp13601_c0_seq1:3997-4182(-)